jgi:hypothetical protein
MLYKSPLSTGKCKCTIHECVLCYTQNSNMSGNGDRVVAQSEFLILHIQRHTHLTEGLKGKKRIHKQKEWEVGVEELP